METRVIGRVENPQTLKHDPITIPVAAYTPDGDEVIERFQFRATMPAGAALLAAQAVTPNGILSIGPVVDFLEKSLLEADRTRFLEFLDSDDLMIDSNVLSDTFQLLVETWTGRPTRPRSHSSAGGKRGKQTSKAAARSKA